MESMIDMVILNAWREMDTMGRGMGVVIPALSIEKPTRHGPSTSVHTPKLKLTTQILNLLLAQDKL